MTSFALVLLFSAIVAPANSLHLLYSNDVAGEIEPCGCRADPAGGYDRKASFMRSLQGEILQLDAGNLLFDSTDLAPLLSAQAIRRAEGVVTLLNQLKHDAWTPGPKDFAAGVTTFQKLISQAKFKTLASNLKLKNQKGTPWSREPMTITRRLFKLELIGVIDPSLTWPTPLEALDPGPALTEFNERDAEGAIKIALFHGKLETLKTFADRYPNIRYWISGGEEAFLENPLKLKHSRVFQASYRNTYLGHLTLASNGDLKSHTLLELSEKWIADPPTRNLILKIQKEISRLSPPSTSLAPHPQNSQFQTFPRCADCHHSAFQFWRGTPHSQALQPLLKDQAIRRLECVECHALPLDAKMGFQSLDKMASSHGKDLTIEALAAFMKKKRTSNEAQDAVATLERAWAPVQCENCHGPGNDHPMGSSKLLRPSLDGCVRCHTPHRAPHWYSKDGNLNKSEAEKRLKAMSCPKESS